MKNPLDMYSLAVEEIRRIGVRKYASCTHNLLPTDKFCDSIHKITEHLSRLFSSNRKRNSVRQVFLFLTRIGIRVGIGITCFFILFSLFSRLAYLPLGNSKLIIRADQRILFWWQRDSMPCYRFWQRNLISAPS
ncbi:K+ efflux antiporter 3 [Striga asiatica]|uniref:K+ efflux antiporter 3 n=1 Tax=Striga asiatica TaxID=4170 RepID=A0A5A7R3H7_STRAF|nr:K+ efflux antiporter 3 [Striga asiatica]